MGLYDTLYPKEGGKEFGHVIFEELSPFISVEINELPPVSVEQNKLHIISVKQKETIVNLIQHMPINLAQEEIKGCRKKALNTPNLQKLKKS